MLESAVAVPGTPSGWRDLVVLAPGAIRAWFEIKAPTDPDAREQEEGAAIRRLRRSPPAALPVTRLS